MVVLQQIAELDVLNEVERECVSIYVGRLRKALGADLEEVCVFGSVARGAIWHEGIGIRSDIDLLVVTRQPPSDARKDELIKFDIRPISRLWTSDRACIRYCCRLRNSIVPAAQ